MVMILQCILCEIILAFQTISWAYENPPHTRCSHQLLTSIYTNFGSIASLTETHYLLGQLPKTLNFFTTSWRRASSPAMELALCQSLNTFISTVIRRSKTVTTTVTQRPTEGVSLLSRLSVNPKPSATSGPTDIHSVFASELDSLVTCLFQHLFQIAQRQSLAENSGCFDTYTKVLREIKRAFATLSKQWKSFHVRDLMQVFFIFRHPCLKSGWLLRDIFLFTHAY